MTTIKTKSAAKPATKKKRKFTKHNLERFQRLAAEISRFTNDIPDWFIKRAKSVEGLLLTEAPKGSGMWVASVAGLKTRPHSSQQQALKIWANKARRTVAAAEG